MENQVEDYRWRTSWKSTSRLLGGGPAGRLGGRSGGRLGGGPAGSL